MIINNKELIQSYILTTARYSFNVHEKRILYRIIESLQPLTKGKKLKEKYSIKKDFLGDYILTFPIRDFLKNDTDKNYLSIKTALKSLNKKTFEFEDSDTWAYISIIAMPKLRSISSSYDTHVTFRLDQILFDAFLDFSKGYRKYELKIAMEFQSVYAMRFYELFSTQSKPMRYEIEKLKKILSIESKYKNNPNNFFKRVIEPAKKELDEKSPYSFSYKLEKTGRKYTHILFSPYPIQENENPEIVKKELQSKTSPFWDLDKNIVHYLRENFGFTLKGLQNNIELFKEASKLPNFYDICTEIQGMVRKYGVTNPTGFFVSQLKKMIQDKPLKNKENTNFNLDEITNKINKNI